MSFQALNTAISGLRAAQTQLSNISNNVTNATTPGYSRQIVPQKTQILSEIGTTVGVLTQQATRQVDMNLQRDLWTQISASSMQNTQVEYLQKVQTFHGPPDQGFSIASHIADLRNSFSALSDLPDDPQLLQATVDQANITAEKFNDYGELLRQLRNDTQGDLQTSINRVNGLLIEIRDINKLVEGAESIGNSVAGLQDQRDIAIKELTELIDISFFQRADGVLVVQTREGHELTGDVAHSLRFESVPISAQQYYPESISALYLINETNGGRVVRTDLTERALGGTIGGLVELRDETLPTYEAQLDELAFQMAQRFQAQGLALYTDQNGFIPEDTAPDPTTLPLPTSVTYVDFARNMKVNKDIIADASLLQRGTYNADVVTPSGDNSVIRRVLEFGFGDINYEQAIGTVDLNAAGATPLQEYLGLQSSNNLVLGIDFTSFPEIDDGVPGTNDLIGSLQDLFLDYPDGDQFRITFEEDRGTGFTAQSVVVDLSEAQARYPLSLTAINNAADQISRYINFELNATALTTEQGQASINNYGQIVLNSTGKITIDRDFATLPEAMSEPAIEALGVPVGEFAPVDPSFSVQIGNGKTYDITIEPGDTLTELVDKLTWDSATETGVPGLFVDIDAATGGLILRPGIDDDNFNPGPPLVDSPQYGGDLTVTGGPFVTSAALNGADDGINIVSALFGSYTGTGLSLLESSPVTAVPYAFQIEATSTQTINFRNQYLGPNAGVSTGIFSANGLIDYAQKMIDETSQDFIQAQNLFENEDTLRGIIQRQFSDSSGVNIDEEMSNLIVVQTAYAAAARTITAADEMFQELIDSVR